jgi:hypothetical protein
LELYTKIFAEPARADRVAIKFRKVNYTFKLVEEFHGQFKIGVGKKRSAPRLEGKRKKKKKKKGCSFHLLKKARESENFREHKNRKA